MKMVHGQELQLSELMVSGVIDQDVFHTFSNWRRQLTNSKAKDDILHWWLGCENLRLLLKMSRDLRLNTAPSGVGGESDNATQQLALDAVDDGEDDDMSVSDDGESTESDEDTDAADEVAKSVLANQDADFDEREMCRFLMDQSERKKLIINQLLSLPHSDIQVAAHQLLHLPHLQRWQLFNRWKAEFQCSVQEELQCAQQTLEEHIEQYNNLKAQADAALCRQVDVIGLTTTGAARKRRFLQSLRAKIVIVEEAAEVLESHIVCSLTSDCQHLIMIGDHQQLRPSVNVHRLAEQFHLGVSLFERLVLGGMEPKVLGVQHRMRPDIARLISPAIYRNLENHPSVSDFPNVKGMAHNVFFLHHATPERRDRERSSYSNDHEARMALGLARYLIRRGVRPARISILAAYAAQLHLLTTLRDPQLQDVHITVVDNYQGEENDVIILSLVRNNSDHSVGFLKIANRVCVALSRARHGLYMLGNMSMLSTSSRLWNDVQAALDERGAIGAEFVLRCDVHQDVTRLVSLPNGFPATENFCQQICGSPLQCGHPCSLKCHQDDPHMEQCREQMTRELPCGHSIVQKCHEHLPDTCCTAVTVRRACGHVWNTICSRVSHPSPEGCREVVSKTLPCGHLQQMECHIPAESFVCLERVAWNPPCGHSAQVNCGSPLSKRISLQCTQKVRKTLPCGHVRPMLCFQDVAELSCSLEVERVLPCNHSIRYECTGEQLEKQRLKCMELVTFALPCGHQQRRSCSSAAAPCRVQVDRRCDCGHLNSVDCCDRSSAACGTMVDKTLPCGHQVQLPCSVSVSGVLCQQTVDLLHPLCGHVQAVPCFLSGDEIEMRGWKCNTLVDKFLSCGHGATMACHRDTYGVDCKAEMDKQLPCGHVAALQCHQSTENVKCSTVAAEPLPCGHRINVRCGEDPTGRECPCTCAMRLECGHFCPRPCHGPAPQHVTSCQVLVDKTLPCGHQMAVQCGTKEIVCQVEKTLQCGHTLLTDCARKVSPKDCTWTCSRTLKCGHPCQLKCAEPCDASPCNCQRTKNVEPAVERTTQSSRSMIDRTPCQELLDCGHKCPRYAEECAADLFHGICNRPCKRLLVCGHKCVDRCSKTCPPCKLKCQFSCVHQKCPLNCSCPCKPCQRPCEWKCAHRRCDHLCSEYCNRQACDDVCTKKLQCGHRCGYLCGEICPGKCIRCAAINNYDPKQRYIYLPDCDHSIPVWQLDDQINSQSVRPVEAPRCPQCSSPIRSCHRYGDAIKSFYEDVLCAKEMACRVNLEVGPKLHALVRQLESERCWSEGTSWAAECNRMIQTGNQLQSKSMRLSNLDMWGMFQRANVLLLLQLVTRDVHGVYPMNANRKKQNISIRPQFVESVEKKLAAVWASVAKYQHFSTEYYEQVIDEVFRIEIYGQWCVLDSVPAEHLTDRRRLKDIGRKLQSDEVLDEEEEEAFTKAMVDEASPLKLDLLLRGRQDVELRLGMDRAAWFKCPLHETVFCTLRNSNCPHCSE